MTLERSFLFKPKAAEAAAAGARITEPTELISHPPEEVASYHSFKCTPYHVSTPHKVMPVRHNATTITLVKIVLVS